NSGGFMVMVWLFCGDGIVKEENEREGGEMRHRGLWSYYRRLLNFVDKAVVEDVIPILVVAFHCQLQQVLSLCIDQVVRSDLDTISLEKELPFEVAQNVRSLRNNSQENDEHTVEVESEGSILEKRIKSVHKALDCEDVELLNMILNESKITLDEACALHYVVSYCDQKVAKEVLDLNRANVNLRNSRGYTVLHVAAMRKEPSIIVSLLNKGANASDTTHDGQSAVSICRRLTRPKDYHAKIEHGQETNKDRICIDVLEREIRRNPMKGDVSVCSSEVADDLHMKLLYLENRVAFARLLFPSEAKLAMEIAHAQTTSEFPGLLGSKGSSGNLREMDLNETPLVRNKRLLSRMEALSRTVEMGRRYFPHCSEVLDKFMEDELHEFCYMENGTLEEQDVKRTRYVELKEEVQDSGVLLEKPSKGEMVEVQQMKPMVQAAKKSKRGPRSRSSQYRGVTFIEKLVQKIENNAKKVIFGATSPAMKATQSATPANQMLTRGENDPRCGVGKQVRIFLSKLVFTFPGEFRTSHGIPPNLDDQNTDLLQSFDFPVHNLYRFFDEIKLIFDLDLIQWNDKRFVKQTLLQARHMECTMNLV
ncbi:regulatory protein NPR3, partial [Tanacetum coccineum]